MALRNVLPEYYNPFVSREAQAIVAPTGGTAIRSAPTVAFAPQPTAVATPTAPTASQPIANGIPGTPGYDPRYDPQFRTAYNPPPAAGSPIYPTWNEMPGSMYGEYGSNGLVGYGYRTPQTYTAPHWNPNGILYGGNSVEPTAMPSGTVPGMGAVPATPATPGSRGTPATPAIPATPGTPGSPAVDAVAEIPARSFEEWRAGQLVKTMLLRAGTPGRAAIPAVAATPGVAASGGGAAIPGLTGARPASAGAASGVGPYLSGAAAGGPAGYVSPYRYSGAINDMGMPYFVNGRLPQTGDKVDAYGEYLVGM